MIFYRIFNILHIHYNTYVLYLYLYNNKKIYPRERARERRYIVERIYSLDIHYIQLTIVLETQSLFVYGKY